LAILQIIKIDGTAKSRYGHPKTALAPLLQGIEKFLTLESKLENFWYYYSTPSLKLLLGLVSGTGGAG